MAIIARLAGEGIGPFKSFDFDFSDAEGRPHPGPHIFAGINGSGKSTVLQTLACLLESGTDNGIQWEDWLRLTDNHPVSRAMVLVFPGNDFPIVEALTTEPPVTLGWDRRLTDWVRELLVGDGASVSKYDLSAREVDRLLERRLMTTETRGGLTHSSLKFGGERDWAQRILFAAYGPSRLLRSLREVNLSVQLKSFKENALSFEASVQNEAIQSWLLGIFSKMAIAKERGQNTSQYSKTLDSFESALRLLCEQDVKFSVDIEPSLQPRLVMYGKSLEFSQLPDGVRSTVGWLADFLMRSDLYQHQRMPQSKRAYGLLLDEVDAHLHPRWQRSILPSIKQALPEVQVFATSHSPFVISSCPGARIHVLALDDDGFAHNRPAEDAPIGESLLATMKGIFGVSSRFDIETERLLEEWDKLHRSEAGGTISAKEKERMAELTKILSSRSEELRQIVSPVVSISDSLAASLKSQAQGAAPKPKIKMASTKG